MNGLILDVIVVVIAVLLVIFGVWRGMYKLIYGLVSSIIALVLAVVLASTVTTLVIEKTNVDDMLYESLDENIQGFFPDDLDASNVDITFNVDGTVTVTHGAEVYDSVNSYLQNTSYAMLGEFIDSMVNSENTTAIINPDADANNPTAVSTTLARLLSTSAIVYILLAIVFVILWIVCYIVVRLLMLLLKKVVHGTYVGHFVDKLLGFVIGGVLAMVLVWGALAIIRLLGTYTWIIPVNEIINTSTITKILYENNFLYDFLVSSTNLQETIVGLIDQFSEAIPSTSTEETASLIANNNLVMLTKLS